MSRFNRTAGPVFLFLFIVLPLTASGQKADSTADVEGAVIGADAATGDIPAFAYHADNYRIRVFPELSFGLRMQIANPDLGGQDAFYTESTRPSADSPLASIGLQTRLQINSWLGVTASTEYCPLGGHSSINHSTDWIRSALTVTGHFTPHPTSMFSFYGGAGVTRIDYEFKGYPVAAGRDIVRHIKSREVGMHMLMGAEIDMIGGPILGMSVGYDFMPTVEDVSTSAFIGGAYLLFQF
ncbi:hypothetical protein KQI65_13520 [bacterium]|nr:hypothetical protein [bacterium]